MAKTEEKELTFEESLEKLESIVKKLESGEVKAKKLEDMTVPQATLQKN